MPELVGGVVQDLVDRDDEQVGGLRLRDLPDLGDAGIPLVVVGFDGAW